MIETTIRRLAGTGRTSAGLLAAGVLLVMSAQAAPPTAAQWQIDPGHSQVSFSVRHLMISNVRGAFTKFSGRLEGDLSDPSGARIEAMIDAASIDTGNPDRDEELRGEDFFDTEKYPTVMFSSKKIVPEGKGGLKMVGDLTIRGVTKEVTLDVTGPTPEMKDPWGHVKVAASATTVIKRSEFGITWNKALDAGGVLVGDEVTITLDIELTKEG